MKIFQLLILCLLILLSNKILSRVDYNKIFKKNSHKEIYILNIMLSIILGYLLFEALLSIYTNSLLFNI